ncbi:hypothetical protein DFH08DRAFT_800042 [Mycena albidolilacea]|uniref:Uncharacterized protein n=1 Tax=Mycena albidolilacea TaxID=1033008 RepID=A0AAD7ANX2_9AGAR|nr:hypothetical protein DFH08DRAFT_800042 [Mycena albidolilacea]
MFMLLKALSGASITTRQLAQSDTPTLHQEWVERYGRTLKYDHFFRLSRLYTMNTKALNHILTNNNVYQRPPHWCYLLSLIVRPGIFVTEEDVHRRQLRNIWAEAAANGPVRLDAVSGLNRATLDIIGLAGFNYTFNSLNAERPAELATAFTAVMPLLRGAAEAVVLDVYRPAVHDVTVPLRNCNIEGQDWVRGSAGQHELSKPSVVDQMRGASTVPQSSNAQYWHLSGKAVVWVDDFTEKRLSGHVMDSTGVQYPSRVQQARDHAGLNAH